MSEKRRRLARPVRASGDAQRFQAPIRVLELGGPLGHPALERGIEQCVIERYRELAGDEADRLQAVGGERAATASASNWCHGNPFSTSASASTSPASCVMLAASNGASAGNAGWGYEGDLRPHLLVAMGAAPAPSGKGSRCSRARLRRRRGFRIPRLKIT
jgi:hypothetical protein